LTNTVDGPMAGLVGGNAPSITMRVQGLKSRTDIDIMGRTGATVMADCRLRTTNRPDGAVGR
jgi:hypothetical protein